MFFGAGFQVDYLERILNLSTISYIVEGFCVLERILYLFEEIKNAETENS